MPYEPLVYRSSGGDQLNIAAGGGLRINGVDFVTTGGYLGDQRLFFENATGTSGAITDYGITIITSTDTTGNRSYSVVPAAGRVKYILCVVGTGSTSNAAALTTGTWDGTNTTITFSTGAVNPQAILAVGISTSRWYTMFLTTDYALS